MSLEETSDSNYATTSLEAGMGHWSPFMSEPVLSLFRASPSRRHLNNNSGNQLRPLRRVVYNSEQTTGNMIISMRQRRGQAIAEENFPEPFYSTSLIVSREPSPTRYHAQRSSFVQLSEGDWETLPSSLWSQKDRKERQAAIQRLRISHSPLQNLSGIRHLKHLTHLDIVCTQLTHLPDELGYLTHLVRLHVESCYLTQVSSALSKLTKLQALCLRRNRLTSLPNEAVACLKSLVQLDVSHNRFECLPESLCRLGKLEILQVKNNRLMTLPAQFGKLQQLRKLSAKSNHLTSLPESIQHCTRLEQLLLADNGLSTIPDLKKLTLLKRVHLQNNQLMKPPLFLGTGARLVEVNLSCQSLGDENMLHLLSESLCWRARGLHLRYLYLNDCGLTVLPDAIGCLSLLWFLSVQNNRLTQLPESLGHCHHLREIRCSRNKLTHLPVSLLQHTKLEILDCSHNNLKEFPLCLNSCRKQIILDYNKLMYLPVTWRALWKAGRMSVRENAWYLNESRCGELVSVGEMLKNPPRLLELARRAFYKTQVDHDKDKGIDVYATPPDSEADEQVGGVSCSRCSSVEKEQDNEAFTRFLSIDHCHQCQGFMKSAYEFIWCEKRMESEEESDSLLPVACPTWQLKFCQPFCAIKFMTAHQLPIHCAQLQKRALHVYSNEENELFWMQKIDPKRATDTIKTMPIPKPLTVVSDESCFTPPMQRHPLWQTTRIN